MLACARIGAAHTVVFGGFSAERAARPASRTPTRSCVITADGGYRRGKPARAQAEPSTRRSPRRPTVEHVLVVRRTGQDVAVDRGPRRLVARHRRPPVRPSTSAEAFDAEHPLFILYTSGTTGKPKGILHTTGGYLTQARLHPPRRLRPQAGRPTSTGAPPTSAGSPGTPTSSTGRWPTAPPRSCTRAPRTPRTRAASGRSSRSTASSIFYTAPTAIRTFMKWGDEIPAKYDLSSLRVLGSVGEPINPEAWMWYRENIGGDRCPDRRHLVADRDRRDHDQPAAGRHRDQARLGDARRCPASAPTSSTTRASRSPTAAAATWCSTKPWPSMLRGIWGDDERYKRHLLVALRDQGCYFAGDGAKKDDDGDIWLLGRVDDVMNVSGHRISTTEVESALVSHPTVAEAAVVGATDEHDRAGHRRVRHPARQRGRRRGRGRGAIKALRDHVAKEIGPIAKPRADHGRRRAAEDPLRQDHAPAAARRRRAPRRSATSPPWPTRRSWT